MDTDERLMSLMAAAEDHQSTVTQLIEVAREREARQSATFTDRMQRMEDKHGDLTARYDALLHQQSIRLLEVLDWRTVWVSVAVTTICCLLLVLGATLYLGHLTDEIHIAKNRYDQLKHYNVKVSSCTHDGRKHPCVRVKKSWGAYGEGDVFILDVGQ